MKNWDTELQYVIIPVLFKKSQIFDDFLTSFGPISMIVLQTADNFILLSIAK